MGRNVCAPPLLAFTTGAVISGTPGEVGEQCKAFKDAGADILLCLLNPYNVSNESSMQTIDLMSKHVLPHLG